MTGYSLHRLHDAVGTEVRGLDVSRPLEPSTRDALKQAWLDHPVLVFRSQDLTAEAQKQFCGQFGPIGVRTRKAEERPEGREAEDIMLVTNVRRNGVPIGSLPDGEMYFHHDKCYVTEPDRGTMLYAIEVTTTGGHTCFANMYAAWESLNGELRDRIEGRRALQIYKYLPTERVNLDDDLERYDHCWQPAVVTHPLSRRRALYVNELMTALIEGYDRDESRALIDAIITHVKSAGVIYEHRWCPGDLVMWDNWCTMHARTDFPR